jgi:biotin carboxylase
MKKIFLQNAIPTANYRLIGKSFKKSEIEGISFPAVIKPVDSQGQRGIYKVDSAEEIKRHIADTLSFSREDAVLIEEYYESDEITVNGWLENGKLTLLSVVDRVTLSTENRIGICIAHNFPSVHLSKYYDEIEDVTEKIVSVFGFENGPVYFQYLIGEEGIRVNEIAMRIGGAYEDITLPMISGIDVLDMLIDSVKGRHRNYQKMNDYSLGVNEVFLSTQMFFLRPGKISKIIYCEAGLKKCGAEKVYIAVKENDKIGGIKNATARAGYFIVRGKSYEDMADNIKKAYEEIKILDENGENMIINYFGYPNRYKFAKEGIVL